MTKRTAGFTLPELLVSLAILGFVTMMLLQGVQTGQRVWEKIDTRRARYESVVMAQLGLREVIENLAPFTRYDGDTPYTDFYGTSEEIAFFAPSRDAQSPDSMQQIKLQRAANGDIRLAYSNNLSFTNLAFSTSDATRRVDTLIAGVEQMEIAYLGVAPPDNRLRWRNRWIQQTKAPNAIRLRVSFEPGDKRIWPELIIRPLILVDVDCLLNVDTGSCQGRK